MSIEIKNSKINNGYSKIINTNNNKNGNFSDILNSKINEKSKSLEEIFKKVSEKYSIPVNLLSCCKNRV